LLLQHANDMASVNISASSMIGSTHAQHIKRQQKYQHCKLIDFTDIPTTLGSGQAGYEHGVSWHFTERRLTI
jgi:hypothetical protein